MWQNLKCMNSAGWAAPRTCLNCKTRGLSRFISMRPTTTTTTLQCCDSLGQTVAAGILRSSHSNAVIRLSICRIHACKCEILHRHVAIWDISLHGGVDEPPKTRNFFPCHFCAVKSRPRVYTWCITRQERLINHDFPRLLWIMAPEQQIQIDYFS